MKKNCLLRLILKKPLKVVVCLIFIMIVILLSRLIQYNEHYSNHEHIYTMEEMLTYEQGYEDITNEHFLRYVQQKWLGHPSDRQYQLEEFRNNSDYSQIGQSGFVNGLLDGKRFGFFIECGAANGEYLSNTLFFEKTLNWTGLLIEPNPKLYKEILNKNRKAYASNTCLNLNNRTDKMEFKAADECGGLYLQPLMAYRSGEDIWVQCVPLYSLLLALHIKHVDYMSLDVEGPELDILHTIPYNRVFIDVIGVEYRVTEPAFDRLVPNSQNRQKLNQLREFFNSTGLYREVGILPHKSEFETVIEHEIQGLDVFFKRL